MKRSTILVLSARTGHAQLIALAVCFVQQAPVRAAFHGCQRERQERSGGRFIPAHRNRSTLAIARKKFTGKKVSGKHGRDRNLALLTHFFADQSNGLLCASALSGKSDGQIENGCLTYYYVVGATHCHANHRKAFILLLRSLLLLRNAQLEFHANISLVVGIHYSRKNSTFIGNTIGSRTTFELHSETLCPNNSSVGMPPLRNRSRIRRIARSIRKLWILIIHDPSILFLQSLQGAKQWLWAIGIDANNSPDLIDQRFLYLGRSGVGSNLGTSALHLREASWGQQERNRR